MQALTLSSLLSKMVTGGSLGGQGNNRAFSGYQNKLKGQYLLLLRQGQHIHID
jgi:hypothetical protein